jgi:hypothetical protein
MMKPEDFQQYFGVLQKSGETTRSIIYAFVLTYGAMLFYGANTYIYPSSQHLFTAMQRSINSAIECDNSPAGTPCFGPLIATSSAEKINTEYSTHLLEYFQDRSVGDREFHVPFVGISPDRDWFWLINIVTSLLFYVLIRGSLSNHLHLIEYIYQENKDDTGRVMLLTTTQIVTSSSRSQAKVIPKRSLILSAEFISISTLLLLPIAVSCFILFDWNYLVFTADVATDIILRPSLTLGFLATLLVLGWQARMFRGIITSIYRLFESDQARQIEVLDSKAIDETPIIKR